MFCDLNIAYYQTSEFEPKYHTGGRAENLESGFPRNCHLG